METQTEPPVEFNDLMFQALDHGFGSIENNSGPLIPFVIVRTESGEKTLHRFVTEKLEDGLARAEGFVRSNKGNLAMYGIAWDGFVTIEGRKTDAIFVEAGMRDRAEAYLLCQRYELKGFWKKKNVRIGNPALVGNPQSRLTG